MPDMIWLDISDEEYREYVFPNEEVIRIEGGLNINLEGSGHRIITTTLSWYIPAGWIALRWQGKDGHAYGW